MRIVRVLFWKRYAAGYNESLGSFGCHGLPKEKFGVAAACNRSPAFSTLEGRVLYSWHMKEQCTATAARKRVSCLSCSGRDVLQGSVKPIGLFGRHILRRGGIRRRRRSQMRIFRKLSERDALLGLAETGFFDCRKIQRGHRTSPTVANAHLACLFWSRCVG
jgi:hypothetical protein